MVHLFFYFNIRFFLIVPVYGDTNDADSDKSVMVSESGYWNHQFYFEVLLGYGFDSDGDYYMPAIPTSYTNYEERSGKKSIGDSASYGLEMGYRFSNLFKASVSYNYFTDFSLYYPTYTPAGEQLGGIKGDASSHIVMANFYLTLKDILRIQSGRFNPYIGVGVGAAMHDLGTLTQSYEGIDYWQVPGVSKTHFAWRIMAGTEMALTQALFLDLGYRYYNIGDFESSSTATYPDGFSSHVNPVKASNVGMSEIYAGISYGF